MLGLAGTSQQQGIVRNQALAVHHALHRDLQYKQAGIQAGNMPAFAFSALADPLC